ncbi:MAG: hypothetical protein ACRDA4_08135 [Filifactoraceae bacterium]
MGLFYIEESESTLIAQLRKVDEENDEFNKAIIKNDRANLLEEFWDKIQADLGILKIYGISKEELNKAFDDHKKKLEKRGHNFIEIR